MTQLERKISRKWSQFYSVIRKNTISRKIEEARRLRQGFVYKDHPKLTVIVQFFNKRQNIRSLISGLRSTLIEEVIVIDDGSVDGSYNEWLTVLNQPNDFLLRCNDLFEVRTYDRAMRMAKGELICLLQDDDIPPSNDTWLKDALTLFEILPDLLILGGRGGIDLLIPDPIQPGEKSEYKTVGNIGGRPGVNKHRVYDSPKYLEKESGIPFMFTMSVNRAPTFIRRKEFLELGGINQEFAPFQGDDDDAAIRAWLAGYKVGLYPCPFERNIGIGGMRLFNSERTIKQDEINSKKLYSAYFNEIDNGHLQNLVDAANKGLVED